MPQKTIESPIERKSPFPDESAGWPAFLWKQGTQKNQATFHFHYLCYLCNKIRVYRKWKCYSSYRIFSIIFDFIAQTDLFNSACHHHQSPSNQYSYYKFKLIRDNYSIIIVTLYISNVRYTCLYIITRYHSSYQIQTIIYILLVSLLENWTKTIKIVGQLVRLSCFSMNLNNSLFLQLLCQREH